MNEKKDNNKDEELVYIWNDDFRPAFGSKEEEEDYYREQQAIKENNRRFLEKYKDDLEN